ncbi:MAG: hypothetical protein QOE06_841, partial [Thermoleophilaceae bacterium]|nr:hypothetical protein [Thermoleophilaceae bacterium]
ATAGGYSAVATFPGNAVLESKASKKLVLTAG